MSATHKILIGMMWVLIILLVSDAARAERIKEIASIAGVRSNQLVGYGIVVGLDGTGETPMRASILTMLCVVNGVFSPVPSRPTTMP